MCHLAWAYLNISYNLPVNESFFIFVGPVTYPDELLDQNWEKREEKYNVKHLFEILDFRGKTNSFSVLLKKYLEPKKAYFGAFFLKMDFYQNSLGVKVWVIRYIAFLKKLTYKASFRINSPKL